MPNTLMPNKEIKRIITEPRQQGQAVVPTPNKKYNCGKLEISFPDRSGQV